MDQGEGGSPAGDPNMTEIGVPPEDETGQQSARAEAATVVERPFVDRPSAARPQEPGAPGAPGAPAPVPVPVSSPWGPPGPQPAPPAYPGATPEPPPYAGSTPWGARAVFPPPPPPGSGGGWSQPPWGQWAPPPWTPQPRPPARPAGWMAGVAVALVAVGAAGGAGIALGLRSSSSTALLSPSSQTGQNPPGSLAPLPTPASGSSGSGGGSLDPTSVAAKVDPAVVDVNVTMAGGTAEGTGMVLTSSGEILTNNHVVEGADTVTVQVNGTGPQLPATVVGVDPTDDVALLQLSGQSGMATVPIGNSSNVSVGDAIAAIGNALGVGGTPALTQGTVTALDQTITASDTNGANSETLTGMIQVQANIQPGDSGGPVVNASGQVIGMTTAGSARARRSGTVGFAIPINRALSIAQQIQSGGGTNILPGHRGILGVIVSGAASAASGAPVTSVQSGSPAEKAGIKAGDIITSVDGSNVDSPTALGSALQSHRPGDTVKIGWTDSSGGSHSASITLEAGPPA